MPIIDTFVSVYRGAVLATGLTVALMLPGTFAAPSDHSATVEAAAPPTSAEEFAVAASDPISRRWRLVLDEGFDRDAPLGRFSATYPGWAGYDSWQDTSRTLGRPRAQQGTYDSSTTTTVRDGLVDIRLHTRGLTPQVMALTPPLPAARSAQLYGRYAVRFRSDVVPGYKMAWLLWPASDSWGEGEIDFPEGDLGGVIEGYSHDTLGSPEVNAWSISTGTSSDQWHTAVIEWSPTAVRFILDGRVWATRDTSAIPRTEMRWVLQTETQLSAQAPDPEVSGHVYIDSVAIWARR
jgi:hypothetical protein